MTPDKDRLQQVRIDEKALDVACNVYQQFDPPAFRPSMKAAIAAYLAALPKSKGGCHVKR